jgi:plastocyanin
MRRVWILIPILVLAGCGGSSNSNSEETQGGGAVLKTIPISEKEYSITPSTVTLDKPGTYEFKVTNDGQITHAFNIEEGEGGAETEAGDIEPGQMKTVRFTFSGDGSFEMYCPKPGHKDRGMEGTIVVGGAAGAGTTTNGETETDGNMTTGQTTTSKGPGY